MGDPVLKAALVALAAIAAVVGVAHADGTGRVVGRIAVTEPDGKSATGADVIVYVVGYDEPPGRGKTTGALIAQTGRKFVPDLVAITAGEQVTFPNGDSFFHNVFSQSSARKFDLGSFRKGESKSKDFPTLGVVDVFCNIHPEMAATILVLPNHRYARTKADGSYVIDGVRAGAWKVFAYTRRAQKPAMANVVVTPGKDATINLAIARSASATAPHQNKFGEQYHDAPHTY